MAGVIFTEKAGDRISDAVRWVEGERGRRPAGPVGGGMEPTLVRVTSSTADGNGHYPGVITVRDPDGDWQDYSAVKVLPLNGEVLTSGTRYGCRGIGFAAGGAELYTPLAAAAAAVDSVVVQVTGELNAWGYYPAKIVTWGGSTWVDGASVYLHTANAETLAVGKRYLAVKSGAQLLGDAIYVMDGGVPPVADCALVAYGTVGGVTGWYKQAYDGEVWEPAGSTIGAVTAVGDISLLTDGTMYAAFRHDGGAWVVFGRFATPTHFGLVSIAGQRFGGHKTFAAGLTAVDEVFVDEEEGAGEEGRGRLWLKLRRTMPGGMYGTATASEAIIGLWQTGMDPVNTYPPDMPCIRLISPVLGDPAGVLKLSLHAMQRLHLVTEAIRVNEDGNGWTGTGGDGAPYVLGIRTGEGDGGASSSAGESRSWMGL